MKRILALSVFLVLSLACDRPKPVLEISNHLWPEGTAISVIHEGKVVASSALYGDHVRISVPKRGVVTVRAAAPTALTSFSPELTLHGGVVSCPLPIPVTRRQAGTVNLGIGCMSSDAAPVCLALVENFAASVTSLSLATGDGASLTAAIARAHAKAVEVILRADCRKDVSVNAAFKTVLVCADEAERSGADGILFLPADTAVRSVEFPKELRALAASLHDRGMSLIVALTPEVLRDFHPVVLFDQVPAPECPDELRVLCYGAGPDAEIPAVASSQQMEDVLLKVMEEKIPLSRISIEVRLSAQAAGVEGKTLRPVALAPGELEKILAEAGTGSVIRLGDGALMLGYKGVDYQYEDLTGIARKMRVLRSGEFLRLHGVHVLYDGLGVKPDAAGLKELAGVFGGK